MPQAVSAPPHPPPNSLMTYLPHMAARLFGTPLLIHGPKLELILTVLGPRIGLSDITPPHRGPPIERPLPATTPQIAVLPIYGTLVRRTFGIEADSGLTSYTAIADQLDAALANPAVAAILLDIDSPGGEAGGLFDLAARIRTSSQLKPIWAVANEMAYSAAYALAASTQRIFVPRTAGVGSVGVIAMHLDQSARDMQQGLRYTAVFAGERKNDLNPHQPLTDAAQSVLQAEVDRLYQLFVETTAQYRRLSPEMVRATQAGIFFGEEAVSLGLADNLGSFDDAVKELASQVGHRTNPSSPSTFTLFPKKPVPLMNTLATTADTSSAQTSPTDSMPSPTPSISAALEIAQTCALAGRTDLIPQFLEAQLTPLQVRTRLLATQADASTEITSQLAPAATTSSATSLNANPLLQAVKRRLES